MIQLDATNVLLKPSQRKQMMAWLRRALRFGDRIGQFACTITLHRVGRFIEARAAVRDRVGQFVCKCRGGDWRHCVRNLARSVCGQLHDQYIGRSAMA